MRYFIFGGKDVSSDRGSFRVVVRAESLVEAERLLKEHLRIQEREDLIPVARCSAIQPAYDTGVVSSDVERQ